VGGGAWLCGVGGEGEPFVGFEGHGLKHEVESADGGVVEVLAAAAVQAHVVGRPQGAELLAAGGQLPEKLRPEMLACHLDM
jgi:hypothetical protein